MGSIFKEADTVVPTPFQEPTLAGTGSETTDSFIASRIALMSDNTDDLKTLAISQMNIKQMEPVQISNYIKGAVADTALNLEDRAIDFYSSIGDVNGAVDHVAELRSVTDPSLSELEQLAITAPMYLDQFEKYSIPQEVARRNILTLMVAMKMEERGMKLDSMWNKAKSMLGALVPGRASAQFALSPFEFAQEVIRFQTLGNEEVFKQFPKLLDDIAEMSGDNPFYFMDRAQAFLDPDDVDTLHALLALDTIDAATIVLAAPKLLKFMEFVRASSTPIKFLRDTGQVGRAATLVDKAAGDAAAAKTLGTTQADAAQTMSPFGGEGLDPAINDALSAETQAIVAGRQAAVADILAPLQDQNQWIRRHPWTPAAIAAANAKRLEQFAGRARIVSQEADGVTLEVTVETPRKDLPTQVAVEKRMNELQDEISTAADMIGSIEESLGPVASKTDKYLKSIKAQKVDAFLELKKQERLLDRVKAQDALPPNTIEIHKLKYGTNDFGEMEAIQYENALKNVTSPSTHVEQMMPGKVATATLIDNDTARLIGIFLKARNKIIAGIGRKGRKKIDSILMKGDQDQVVYSNRDLADGVMTQDGLIKLKTAEELAAYRSTRDMFDVLHSLKNKELRRKLELDGFKSLSIRLGDGSKSLNFVRPTQEVDVENLRGVRKVYDAKNSAPVDVSQIPNDGTSQLYKLKYPLQVGGESFEYVLAASKSLKDLPIIVLSKRIGYVTKIDKNIFYVAERIGDKVINGVTKSNYRTVVRYFDNPKDAEEWAANQTARGETTQIRSGREWLDLSPGRREEFEEQIFGGLYGGERGATPVPFGLEGTPAERVGGIEAMEAYMNHISLRMPAVDFRASLVQSFLNSAHDPITGESFLEDASNWRSKVRGSTDHKIKSGLEAAQTWIEEQVRIPTTEERVWGNVSQKLADYFSRVPGPAGKKLAKVAMNIGAKDAFTRMRGLAFHATLGWFNPSQFMVQAMGASIAISLDPVRAPLFMARSLALRATMFDIFKESDKTIELVARAAFMEPNAFRTMVRAYQKTGLHESTLTTGDYSALQGFPNGADLLRKVASAGLIPFKEGERWARNYAWIKAYDDVTKGSKITAISDEMIDQVTSLHLRYTMNLNRANRAAWQRGILSIPTQFMQISAKFIENMAPNILINTPKGWSGTEKAQILLGQGVLFGAAGIPFGQTIRDSFLKYWQSDEEYGLAIKDPEKIAFLEGGLSELMLYNWTGERLDVVNRLSINAGIEQLVEMLRDDKSKLSDIALGVTGSFSDRSMQAISANYRILWSIMQEPGTAEPEVILEVMDNIAQVASSWRNYRKAQLWEQLGYIQDRYGNKIMEIDKTQDANLLFAQKLGLSPKELNDLRAYKKFNRNREQDYRDAADAIILASNRYYNNPDMLTNEKLQKRLQAEIEGYVWGFTEEERADVMERVYRARQKEGFILPEQMEKALDNMYKSHGAAEMQGVAGMVDTGETSAE